MALAIATNNAAIQSAAAASSVNRDMETSMARLSTGKRINSARDDAAGVAIASRLSSEIRGTDQAIRNSVDGQALIDTAEGGHKEIENILQRMREISVQSANDTNNTDDRANLQSEMTALITEIDRIASVTTWAGQSMMDSEGSTFKFQVGTATGDKNQISVSIKAMAAEALGLAHAGSAALSDVSFPVNPASKVTAVAEVLAVSYVAPVTEVSYVAPVAEVLAVSYVAPVTAVAASPDGSMTAVTGSRAATDGIFTATAGRTPVTITLKGTTITVSSLNGDNGSADAAKIANEINTGTATHTYKAKANDDGTVTIIAPPGATSVTTFENSRLAVKAIDGAIKAVNTQRSSLGAISNRLSHTVNNLTNISSNLSAAKGGIEDADFAFETTELAKNQILQQASTAMLAQGNASKQNVLSLLQG